MKYAVVIWLASAIVFAAVVLSAARRPWIPDGEIAPPDDGPLDDDDAFFAGPYGLDRSTPEHTPDHALTRGGNSDGSGVGRSHSPANPVGVADGIRDPEILCGYLLAALTRDGMAQLKRERAGS